MDAVSVLPAVSVSNSIAGLAASGASGSALTPDLSATAAALAAQPSTQVLLSQFAQGVLAQQAGNPALNIDTAVATTLSSLLSASSGPLYTATGQLQQFAGASLLTQGTSATTANAQTQQLLADAARPVAAEPGSPASANSVQALQDVADAARQAFIASQLTALDAAGTDSLTSTAVQTGTAPNSVAGTQISSGVITATAAGVVARGATAVATPTAAVATTPSATGAALPATPEPVPTAVADALPTTSDVLDPYQQAALASGQTVFGKELNSFVPGSAEADFPAEVRALSAVRPVVPRRDEPQEASADTPG
ncbi:MAG TPA: hypothetical protein VLC92_06620 [Rhodocyclaceae bacterium]|nr:hypothetical protein [Rhodocyclaceae bacterium]